MNQAEFEEAGGSSSTERRRSTEGAETLAEASKWSSSCSCPKSCGASELPELSISSLQRMAEILPIVVATLLKAFQPQPGLDVSDATLVR